MNPSSNVCKIDAYPNADFPGIYGHEDHTDLLVKRVATDSSSTFCRVFYVIAIKIANRDSSIPIYDGSQDHSSFWLLQRAASHHYHGLFIGQVHQSFDWKYNHECLHSYEDNLGALVLAKTLPPQLLL